MMDGVMGVADYQSDFAQGYVGQVAGKSLATVTTGSRRCSRRTRLRPCRPKLRRTSAIKGYPGAMTCPP